MDPTRAAYDPILARLLEWARGEEPIRAIIVIGSQARAHFPADEFSDLDLILLARDPQPYLSSTDWLARIGKPYLTFTEGTGDGRFLERRALFAGGLDVDFAFLPVEAIHQMLQSGLPEDIVQLIHRGTSAILDKDGLAARLIVPVPGLSPALPPSPEDVLNLVNDFWYHAVWTAKKTGRGELWTAKMCSDSYMKRLLLRMIEWHARATCGWEYDTWHAGRFIEQWAEPRVVAGLRPAFAAYAEKDLWRGLWTTMDLFRALAVETTRRLAIAYPASGDEYATLLVKEIQCKALS